MSLTETFMLVALGFALALLMVLLFGRGFWTIATSFGAKRKEKNLPVQMLELQADRDRLRAEHAIMSRKLELRLEEIKARMTEQMAEVSRSRNRMQTLVEQLETTESTVANRNTEIVDLKAQVEAYQSDLETITASLKNLSIDNSKKDLEITKLGQAISEQKLALREKNKMVARLNEESRINTRARAEIAEPQNSDVADARMKKRISELATISAEMDETQRGITQNSIEPTIEVPLDRAFELKSDVENSFIDIEREAASLTQELKSIEAALEHNSPYPAPKPVKSSAKANIISLTQRIKAMQGDKN